MFENIVSALKEFFSLLRIADIADVAIVAFVFYKITGLVKETRAWQLVKGIVLLLIATWLSDIFQLNTINFILRNTVQVGVLALIILFQPELRRALEKMGRTSLDTFLSSPVVEIERCADEVSRAASIMSAKRCGALMVIERKTKIGDIIGSGTELDARITSELLLTIFFDKTPLHDGAVVISDGKITAAACLLPLTDNESLSRELGTRHRAAIGLSECSDAFVIVVSEETGKISVAEDGALERNFNRETLKEAIETALTAPTKRAGKIAKWKERLKWKK